MNAAVQRHALSITNGGCSASGLQPVVCVAVSSLQLGLRRLDSIGATMDVLSKCIGPVCNARSKSLHPLSAKSRSAAKMPRRALPNVRALCERSSAAGLLAASSALQPRAAPRRTATRGAAAKRQAHTQRAQAAAARERAAQTLRRPAPRGGTPFGGGTVRREGSSFASPREPFDWQGWGASRSLLLVSAVVPPATPTQGGRGAEISSS